MANARIANHAGHEEWELKQNYNYTYTETHTQTRNWNYKKQENYNELWTQARPFRTYQKD